MFPDCGFLLVAASRTLTNLMTIKTVKQMTMKILAAFVGVAALAAAAPAQFQSPTNPPSQTAFGPIVQWTQVNQGVHCAITQSEMRVLGSEAQWQAHFNRAFPADPGTRREIPRVADWSKEIIIAIHAGQQPTPGYSLNVSTIARRQSGVYDIDVVFEKPNQNAIMPQMVTSPWVVIKVQRTTGTPRLRVIETVSRVIRSSGPSNSGWGSTWGEMPIYKIGEGGKLIPLNEEARRRMGQTGTGTKPDPKTGSGR